MQGLISDLVSYFEFEINECECECFAFIIGLLTR